MPYDASYSAIVKLAIFPGTRGKETEATTFFEGLVFFCSV